MMGVACRPFPAESITPLGYRLPSSVLAAVILSPDYRAKIIVGRVGFMERLLPMKMTADSREW